MVMTTFTVEVPDEQERGLRVGCKDHDQWEVFQPGYRTVAFYCDGCGFEIEVNLQDTLDWRDLEERC